MSLRTSINLTFQVKLVYQNIFVDQKYETTKDEIQNIEIITDVTFLNVLKINRKFDFIQPLKN